MANASGGLSAAAGSEFRVMPAGEFRPQDGRPLKTSWKLTPERGMQVVVVAALREIDYVIDYEHQTLNKAKNGQPAPAAGWFRKLEMRPDGLYVIDARWTDNAKQMIKAGEYRFISPVFRFDPTTGDVLSLEGLALTNDPALHGLTDLQNVAVNTAQPPKLHKVYEALTENQRDIFVRAFGILPEDALELASEAQQDDLAGVETPEISPATDEISPPVPDGMTEADWVKFQHIFPGIQAV